MALRAQVVDRGAVKIFCPLAATWRSAIHPGATTATVIAPDADACSGAPEEAWRDARCSQTGSGQAEEQGGVQVQVECQACEEPPILSNKPAKPRPDEWTV